MVVFDLLTENIANLANKPGQNVMINNTLLNLNDFIPEKKYYSYTSINCDKCDICKKNLIDGN